MAPGLGSRSLAPLPEEPVPAPVLVGLATLCAGSLAPGMGHHSALPWRAQATWPCPGVAPISAALRFLPAPPTAALSATSAEWNLA